MVETTASTEGAGGQDPRSVAAMVALLAALEDDERSEQEGGSGDHPALRMGQTRPS